MGPRVQALVAGFTEERQRMERFCRSLSEEELARPVPQSTWIVKDFISHVTTLDGPVAGWCAAVAGIPVAGPNRGSPEFNVDEFNDAAVAQRRDQTVEELFAAAAPARAELLFAVGQLDDAQLDTQVRFSGDAKRPPVDMHFGQYLAGLTRHDGIHAADMLKALPERGSDPEVAAWLQQPDHAAAIAGYQKAMA